MAEVKLKRRSDEARTAYTEGWKAGMKCARRVVEQKAEVIHHPAVHDLFSDVLSIIDALLSTQPDPDKPSPDQEPAQ